MSLLSPDFMQYEPPKTLSSQEAYDVENTGRNSLVEHYTSIENHHGNIVNNDDEHSKEYSTSLLNRDTKFLTEITTMHNFNVNLEDEISSYTSTTQSPEVNEGNEFSTIQTQKTQLYINESHLIDKPDDTHIRQKSLLNLEEVLYKALSSVQDEIKDKFLNIESQMGQLSDDPSKYYLEFINKNFINLIDGSVHCRDDDLSASFECLKQTLLQLIRYMTKQRVLKLFDSVHLVRNPQAETRYVCYEHEPFTASCPQYPLLWTVAITRSAVRPHSVCVCVRDA
jgi:hypothetical protein